MGQKKGSHTEKVVFRRNTTQQKEVVIQKLREQGYRITKQRQLLLDIIFAEERTDCKDIYYEAVRRDKKIGMATVYRMLSVLEHMGVLVRSNAYKFPDDYVFVIGNNCKIKFDDGSVLMLSSSQWNTVILKGLQVCGYESKGNIQSIKVQGASI
ncbi:MAG: Fur family transcriptional regulator [Firmicutes bacterium]|nr:Fur family transcriptional regulator [Bacillota bacterium]NBI64761.1 Fur family transcriptional regulator [Clostridiales bacterium]